MIEANPAAIAQLSVEEQEALLRALLANNRDKAKNLIKDVETQEKAREARILASIDAKFKRHVDAFFDELTAEEIPYADGLTYDHDNGRKISHRKGAKTAAAVKAKLAPAPADTSVVA